jgi:hypothetical protein
MAYVRFQFYIHHCEFCTVAGDCHYRAFLVYS